MMTFFSVAFAMGSLNPIELETKYIRLCPFHQRYFVWMFFPNEKYDIDFSFGKNIHTKQQFEIGSWKKTTIESILYGFLFLEPTF